MSTVCILFKKIEKQREEWKERRENLHSLSPDMSEISAEVDANLRHKVKLETVVSYKYTSGSQMPRIYRIRYDLSWQDVLSNYQMDKKATGESHDM